MSADVLETPCGGCGRTLRVAPQHAGKMARCPVCSHITLVPDSAGRAPEFPPPEAVSSAGAAADSADWYMRTPEEQTFGPATFVDLERWVAEGRITTDCQLCQGTSGRWQRADFVFPALQMQPSLGAPYSGAHSPLPVPGAAPFGAAQVSYAALNIDPVSGDYAPAASYVSAHRGALILVVGLIGLFVHCPVFPFMAWVMGSNDLREMDAGRMDRGGRDLTKAGMVIGMILSILWILGFLIIFALMLTGLATH